MGVWRIIFNNRKGIIKGFFGGGKTKRTMRSVERELKRGIRDILIVYAAPLRKLRDFVFNHWVPDQPKTEGRAKVFFSHEEVCPMLRNRILNETIDGAGMSSRARYYLLLAKHMREDDCKYGEHVKEILELVDWGNTRLVATTHELASLVTLVALAKKTDFVVIYDEAEDILEKVSHPIPVQEIERIREIDEKTYSKIRSMLVEENGFYWLRPDKVKWLARSVIITATMPRVLMEYINSVYGWVPEARINTRPSRDRVFLYTGIIPSMKADEPKLMNTLVKLVDKGIEEYGVVGVIAKNLMHERQIVTMLKSLGYRVSSEVQDDRIDPMADVYVLVPGGKWFRGVSIFSQKINRDIPFTIAFYQGGKPTTINPWLHKVFSVLSDRLHCSDMYVFGLYAAEMNYARNLQALYRYNRMRDHEHVMVLLDYRWQKAYRHYHLRKWMEMEKKTVGDIGDIAKIVFA